MACLLLAVPFSVKNRRAHAPREMWGTSLYQTIQQKENIMWWIIFAGFGGFAFGIVMAALLNAAKTADEWAIREMPRNAE